MITLATIGSVLVSVSGKRILDAVADQSFAAAASMMPYLAFAAAAQAVSSFTAIGCNIVEQNVPIARAVVVGALTIPPVVWLGEPIIGVNCVAASTLVSQTITAALVLRSAERVWPVGYGWRFPLGAVFTCAATLALIGV